MNEKEKQCHISRRYGFCLEAQLAWMISVFSDEIYERLMSVSLTGRGVCFPLINSYHPLERITTIKEDNFRKAGIRSKKIFDRCWRHKFVILKTSSYMAPQANKMYCFPIRSPLPHSLPRPPQLATLLFVWNSGGCFLSSPIQWFFNFKT